MFCRKVKIALALLVASNSCSFAQSLLDAVAFLNDLPAYDRGVTNDGKVLRFGDKMLQKGAWLSIIPALKTVEIMDNSDCVARVKEIPDPDKLEPAIQKLVSDNKRFNLQYPAGARILNADQLRQIGFVNFETFYYLNNVIVSESTTQSFIEDGDVKLLVKLGGSRNVICRKGTTVDMKLKLNEWIADLQPIDSCENEFQVSVPVAQRDRILRLFAAVYPAMCKGASRQAGGRF